MADRPVVLYAITDPISTLLLRGQLRYLAEHGFDVHIVCSAGKQADDFARAEGVTLHRLAMAREPSPRADLGALIALVRLVRRLKPAIVNASTPKAGLLGTLAARIGRVSVRTYVVRGLRFEADTGRRRAILRVLERLAIANATHVIFNSRSLRAVAEAEHVVRAGRGVVLGGGSGNGVDVGRFIGADRQAARRALGIRAEEQVVGFVGRLTRDKGIVDLLAAFDTLATTRPLLRLLLVGDFEDGDPLGADVRERVHTDPRITAPGWIDDPAQTYAAMDLLAFPSYREGLPNVPLEAQASLVPVAAYAATGTVDAILDGTTGSLVPVGDVAALSTAIGALLDDPDRRSVMAEAGRHWVTESFAPQRIWADLADLYATSLQQVLPHPVDGGPQAGR